MKNRNNFMIFKRLKLLILLYKWFFHQVFERIPRQQDQNKKSDLESNAFENCMGQLFHYIRVCLHIVHFNNFIASPTLFESLLLIKLSDKFKVHIFWEGHNILRNLHRRFDWHYIGQIYCDDFAKFCGLLRIYEL